VKQKKLILSLLALLISIKFIYLPWRGWLDSQQQKIEQLQSFSAKQDIAINNKALLKSKLIEHEAKLDKFVENIASLNIGDDSNTLWFNLIESIKNKNIKVYNQKSEFESLVTEQIGYVTGSFFISGNPSDVMKAIIQLELKSPYVFIDKLVLKRGTKKGIKNEKLTAQLYVGYWFIRKGVEIE